MAVVTVEKALQLWDEALQTQVHKVETIDVKAAKGYVLAEDIIAPTDVPAAFFQNLLWMVMPSPTKKVVMNISLTVLLVLVLYGNIP